MKLLDLTLSSPQENVALDEALLDQAEASAKPREVLRLWESPEPMVVIGRSSRIDIEVDRQVCGDQGIPILRRSSGGAAVVAGPGCLMYAVVLSLELRPQLQMVSEAHCFVLRKLIEAVRPFVPEIACQGTSDLTDRGRKFSGNSLRVKRNHLLYHGTLLYDFSLDMISRCLRTPPRQPEYREHRRHEDFVMNIPVEAAQLRQAIVDTWDAHEPLTEWPRDTTRQLVESRYSRPEWNERL